MDESFEEMPATMSYVLTVGLMAWMKVEAKRRGYRSVSELAREIIADAKARSERTEQAA